MIPKYPFRVEITYRSTTIGDTQHRESHNYETLQGAAAYAGIQIRKPMVKKVAIAVVLEEMVKVSDSNGNGA